MRIAEVVASLGGRVVVTAQTPRLLAGTGKDNVHLLVVANSDRGLCGAFNANIVKAALVTAQRLRAEGKTVLFYLVGRKGRPAIRRAFPDAIIGGYDTGAMRQASFAEAQAIADDVVALYEAGKFDVAHLFFSRFKSALVQIPTGQQIIPVPPPTFPSATAPPVAVAKAASACARLIGKRSISCNHPS